MTITCPTESLKKKHLGPFNHHFLQTFSACFSQCRTMCCCFLLVSFSICPNRPLHPVTASYLRDWRTETKMVQSCAKEGLNWTSRRVSLPRGWSNTGTDFPERQPMPKLANVLRDAFNNILDFGQPWIGQALGLDCWCRSLPIKIAYSILKTFSHDH